MLPRNVLAIRKTWGSAISSNGSHSLSAPSTTEILTSLTTKTSHATLLDYPPGSYTGMRTFHKIGIMDFTGHTARLANSLQQISFAPGGEEEGAKEDPEVVAGLAALRTHEVMKKETTDLVRAGLKFYYKQFKEPAQDLLSAVGETKVTVLCTWDPKDKNPTLLAHFEPLRAPKTPRCKVEVHGSPRHHATAKDSQWVRDRSELEKALAKDSNEALLLDEATQDLYEGLSSNFFAVHRSTKTVVTAPLDSVLTGTILKVVLNVCEQHNIPVKFAFPNLKHVNDWEGAFISSTSRLVLPIESIVLPDGSTKQFGESATLELIRGQVFKECRKRVENLLSEEEL
ncbi:hypothetical protein CPB97_003665 [Podila verticillata]|nr:hypothetical protein CPB97_003665 [Podila verticillata]